MEKVQAHSQARFNQYIPFKSDKLKAFLDVVCESGQTDDGDGTASVAVDHIYPGKSLSVFSYTMPGVRQELKALVPDLKEAEILASMTRYGDAVGPLTVRGPWFRLIQEVEPLWSCSIKAHYYPPSINASVIAHERKASNFLAMANGCNLEINWDTIKHSSWSGNAFANGDPIVVEAWLKGGETVNFNFSIQLLVGVSTIKGKLKAHIKQTVVENAYFTYEPNINPISDIE